MFLKTKLHLILEIYDEQRGAFIKCKTEGVLYFIYYEIVRLEQTDVPLVDVNRIEKLNQTKAQVPDMLCMKPLVSYTYCKRLSQLHNNSHQRNFTKFTNKNNCKRC